jgi:hypothetical protein
MTVFAEMIKFIKPKSKVLSKKSTPKVISIKRENFWDEYVTRRKHGHKTAHAFIRPFVDERDLRVLVAVVAYYQYQPHIGDIITFEGTGVKFMWDKEVEQCFIPSENEII